MPRVEMARCHTENEGSSLLILELIPGAPSLGCSPDSSKDPTSGLDGVGLGGAWASDLLDSKLEQLLWFPCSELA